MRGLGSVGTENPLDVDVEPKLLRSSPNAISGAHPLLVLDSAQYTTSDGLSGSSVPSVSAPTR